MYNVDFILCIGFSQKLHIHHIHYCNVCHVSMILSMVNLVDGDSIAAIRQRFPRAPIPRTRQTENDREDCQFAETEC